MPQSRCPIYNATQCSNSKRKREWHRCSACRTHVSQGLRGGMTSETVRRFSAIPFQLGFPGCWPKNPLDLPTKPRLTVFLPNSSSLLKTTNWKQIYIDGIESTIFRRIWAGYLHLSLMILILLMKLTLDSSSSSLTLNRRVKLGHRQHVTDDFIFLVFKILTLLNIKLHLGYCGFGNII